MTTLKRYKDNPIIGPDEEKAWEAVAVFNPTIVQNDGTYHALYRAISEELVYREKVMTLSTIGYAKSKDGVNFTDRKQFITPVNSWEQYGCEDPRMTFFEGKYYIFYTAIADYPHTANGIRVALAITEDFEKIEEKHLVTPFNAKAMCMFPERVGGKITFILSVNTDRPPTDIAIAQVDKIEDIWNQDFWASWYEERDKFKLTLARGNGDHVEVGAPPVATDEGWLMVYSHINNYFNPPPVFGIEAVLLNKKDPTQILERTHKALMEPVEEYERYGFVPEVVFPTCALINEKELLVYYGAADTTIAQASVNVHELLEFMKEKPLVADENNLKLERYDKNPVITRIEENEFEAEATYNPTAIRIEDKTYILYRAQSKDNTSTVGMAITKDGYKIEERLAEPIYAPREAFETKDRENAFSGCEDPRITKMGDTLYMCYTAYSGAGTTKIAFTSIKESEFLNKNWNWTPPVVISDPTRNDKNACLFEETVDGKYVFMHRLGGCIWVAKKDNLEFKDDTLGGVLFACPRKELWDSRKIGIAGPPMKVPEGWLLIYHGLSVHDDKYRLSAMLIDDKVDKILARLPYPLIEPETDYEKQGIRHDTIFSCGQAVIDDTIFVYYGGGDKNVGVATIDKNELIKELQEYEIAT